MYVITEAADMLERFRENRRLELLAPMELRKLLAGFAWNDVREQVERDEVELVLAHEFGEMEVNP